MNGLPYWPCYAGDFMMSSAASMTDEQLGAYFRLLNHAWVNDGLPADLEQIRQIGRWSHATFDRLWAIVGPKWESRNDRLINPRQEQERINVQRRSDVGRANVEARWRRRYNGNTAVLPTAYKVDTKPIDPQSQSQSTTPPVPPLARGGLTEQQRKYVAKRLMVHGETWLDRCGHAPKCQTENGCNLRRLVADACPHDAPKCATYRECRTRTAEH